MPRIRKDKKGKERVNQGGLSGWQGVRWRGLAPYCGDGIIYFVYI
jgi:hypothetical protein